MAEAADEQANGKADAEQDHEAAHQLLMRPLQQEGPTITAENRPKPQKGTRFRITFPNPVPKEN